MILFFPIFSKKKKENHNHQPKQLSNRSKEEVIRFLEWFVGFSEFKFKLKRLVNSLNESTNKRIALKAEIQVEYEESQSYITD